MLLAHGAEIAPGLRLVKPIGHGAMGAVWLADREAEGDQVAIKFMPERIRQMRGMTERFKREAELTATIQSHHVVRMLGFGETADGMAYIIMENLDGETLEERLEREGKVSPAFAARVVAQLGAALQAAHDVDVIHRDIKPANLFLVGEGESPVLKVLDFGAAKPKRVKDGSIITATGVAVGSPFLMSPEQVLGSRFVDHRSDLWAFAAVVYRMLCGELPFTADNPSALAFIICKATYRQPSKLGAPPGLDPWFARAFQPAKENRFDSAREMTEEFLAVLIEDEEIEPRPSAEFDDDETTFAEDDEPAAPHNEDSIITRPQPIPREVQESTPSEPSLPSVPSMASEPSLPSVPSMASEPSLPSVPSLAPEPSQPPSISEQVPSTSDPPSPVPLQAAVVPARPLSTRRGRGTPWYAVAAVLLVGGALAFLLLRPAGPAPQAAVADAPNEEPATAEAPPPAPEPSPATAAPEPDEPRPATSAAAPAMGTLTVICVPACSNVEVDGEPWGTSPVIEHQAAAGDHQLALHRPGLPPHLVTVAVTEGKLTVKRVMLPTGAPSGGKSAAPVASEPVPEPGPATSGSAPPPPSASAPAPKTPPSPTPPPSAPPATPAPSAAPAPAPLPPPQP